MKHTLCLALIGLAVSAAPASAGTRGITRVTAKPVEFFAQCFAAAEERASKAWSFIPNERGGGTFSNVGAKGVASPYFLRIADRGSRREIRLEASNAASGASILRAVDRCV